MIFRMECQQKKHWQESPYMQGKKIIPYEPIGNNIDSIIDDYDKCFEGRNIYAGAKLLRERF